MNSLISEHTLKGLRKGLKGKIVYHASLRRYTSLRVGGPAEMVVYPATREELQHLIRYSSAHAVPCLIIGRGTNLLVRDGGVKGMVIKLSSGFSRIKVVEALPSSVKVAVEAGVSLLRFVNFTLSKALSGAEFLTGIPGSLGGALAMNAGAHGKTMQDIVESITWVTPHAEIEEKKRDELTFGYRRLVLPAGTIIMSALVKLQPGNQRAILTEIRRIKTWRRHTQPLNQPSAGSVFKNPPHHAAGQLVEQAGLKGFQVGKAKISEKHANVIVNLGGATAQDILTLMETMQQKVLKDTKIWLEPEIKIVGDNEILNC